MRENLVAPSILSANFLQLGADIRMLNDSAADWIHCDVMDGSFVPNISFGLPVISQVKTIALKPLDVHLMIVEPDRYIEAFQEAGADLLTVHYEACRHLHRTLGRIRQAGMKAGVSLNPHTPVALLEDIITDADIVLLMSVNPGFGGQQFIENTYAKVARLKELVLRKNAVTLLEVDGGVNFDTARRLYAVGADVLVAGSFVFQAPDPADTISRLKDCAYWSQA
ncbi:MAG: ribulose-phosphate 3-epimerase [Bacteroidales bacterium]|jgi:ribulose-phosphate 3-epimerase|nr:ribulose-phosphate 3-epimerase [Bacteroidales bacterium]